jgi:hypothetical protein
VAERGECFLSGGTTFSLLFPANGQIPSQPKNN